jgi:hypothetical protein
MGLTLCNACGSIEGGTRPVTLQEFIDATGLTEKEFIENGEGEAREDLVCTECDSYGEITGIPEHDDYDMER